jgi:hypothetical protein
LPSHISAFRTALLVAALAGSLAVPALATAPTVAELDASARAAGNRKDLAVAIGSAIFTTLWPAQVTQISANEIDSHLLVGIRLWGVHFHQPLTRAAFEAEVVALIEKTFQTQPHVEEVDLWASVPLDVGKGVIVNGDLARPTSRQVFGVTAMRGEPASALAARIRQGHGTYWDEDWARAAFKQGT